MLPSMCRLDSEHAWIFDRWISPQTIVFFYRFFYHKRNLKEVLFFFTDGAHTRSVRPIITVHWSVFIRRTDRVWAASVFFPLVKKNRTRFTFFVWLKKTIEKNDRLWGNPSVKNPRMLRIKSTHAWKH